MLQLPEKLCSKSRSMPHANHDRIFRSAQLGVWEIVYLPPSHNTQNLVSSWKLRSRIPHRSKLATAFDDVQYLSRFVTEIYGLAPRQLITYALENFWDSLQDGLSLYLTSRLLDVVGDRLQGKEVYKNDILWAIFSKVMYTALSKLITRILERNGEILRDRVRYHFMLKAIRAVLNLDLTTAEDPEITSRLGKEDDFADSNEVWNVFEEVSRLFFGVTGMATQLLMAVTFIRRNSTGPVFLVMCSLQPLLRLWLTSESLWSCPFVSYCIEPAFSRMASLHKLVYDEQFRADRLNDGIEEHIEKEFSEQRAILGDKCTEPLWDQWRARDSLFFKIVRGISTELPLLIFAVRTVFDVKDMSIAAFMLMQQTSQAIGWTFNTVSYQITDFSRNLGVIRNIYKLSDIENAIKDGWQAYPRETNLIESGDCGAQIEFCNVSFAYPDTSKNALTDLSFTIKPGQLVVIVGVNGSGKSSMIKLFNRLYDPSAGHILLDGIPLANYRLADIRRTMAILRQDHTPYPLTLRENIALGLPGRAISEEVLWDAARQGGAADFIMKLEKGMETVLHPVKLSTTNFPDETVADLKSLLDEEERTTDISGGERQRLAASRTFMRLSGGDIRFLAADEPTSALDPEGEFELFSRLRELRGGKTIVFITHRFGHLTKYADMILCMKDGHLVEQGTHEELLMEKGEYFKLHDVQAQAFLP
ncbi:P-loop containing nucleoside triphosphate hydrolase protein [Phellopilus nigrolimitatus]|nr:P-loop containing nucleoside triphosphate hydrolase protein [Phellopilus nigrolimitatus]